MSTLSRLTTLTGCVARVVRVDKRAARAEPRASIEAKGRAPVRVANADRETVARSGDVERQTAGCTAEAALGIKTAEGLARIRAARTIHGRYSAENRQVDAMIRVLKAEAKRLAERRD